METVMEVLLGIGGVIIFAAIVAVFIAAIVGMHMLIVFLGKLFARRSPHLDVSKVCWYGAASVGAMAMLITWIAVDGGTSDPFAFVLVMALKGALSIFIAVVVAVLVYAFAGVPLMRSFDQHRVVT